MYAKRPSMRCGRPAFGLAITGKPTPRMRVTISYTPAGPSAQFTPIAAAPQPASFCAICSGPVPSAIVPNGSNDTEATTGTCPAALSSAASSATCISSGERKVSSISTSTPASSTARQCSRNDARTAS